MKMNNKLVITLGSLALLMGAESVMAACGNITREALTSAIAAAETASTVSAADHKKIGGYGLSMWITVVDETGKICHVATSGTPGAAAGNSEWLGSRLISAQKAFTANAFSLDGYAISTANLYTAVQPGGSLFGLQHSNPIDASIAYAGSPNAYGTKNDPLKGKRIGGVNVFGGGLALYNSDGKKIGAVGVSGDTSCRDHNYAWQVRGALGMHAKGVGITTANYNAPGVAQTALTGAAKGDELILQGTGVSYWEAWAQPACPNSTGASVATAANGTLVAP